MPCYTYSSGKHGFCLCLPWLDFFFFQKWLHYLEKGNSKFCFSNCRDFRCKLLVAECPEKAFTLLFSFFGGQRMLASSKRNSGGAGLLHDPTKQRRFFEENKESQRYVKFSEFQGEKGKCQSPDILSTTLYLTKTNKLCTAKSLCWKYIFKWRCRLETLFSCFVYKQTVTPVFQTIATNTQPHLFRMR